MSLVLSPPAADTGSQRHEFPMSGADMERVRALIYKHAGISLQAGKQAMVYSRLSRRLRETGHPDFATYLDELERSGTEAEWQTFVNSLTTNLTAFFREEHHFDILAQELTARRGAASPRIWCCAASTGEEPYSLAITAIEALGAGTSLRIMASDIDTNVLDTARRGVYAADSRGLSPQRLKAHFLRGTGANDGRIRIKPELARLVEFRTFNLMQPRYTLPEPVDYIFCRNVMIYFDAPTQRRVLERMHAVMKPDGLLFVGHSENFGDARNLFKLRSKTVYQRVQG